MSEPFLGQIKLFAGKFTPRGWALCNGQLMTVSSNYELFSLLGTIYGGDGRTTFALPDLRGRVPMHQGTGNGLSPREIGQRGGAETTTLDLPNLPNHSHMLTASNLEASETTPEGNALAAPSDTKVYTDGLLTAGQMDGATLANTGGSKSFSNMMPYQCISYIICVTAGIYPDRS